jgi:hypothetical protein
LIGSGSGRRLKYCHWHGNEQPSTLTPIGRTER